MIENTDTRTKPSGDGTSTRRWTHELGELQTRIRKMKLSPGLLPPAAIDLLEEAIAMSMTLLQELAGSQLLMRKVQSDVRRACATWDYLFDRVPMPCVMTDSAGTIISANRAAALFLNTSARHLIGRLLLHFTDDREKFGSSLLAATSDHARVEEVLPIRPKERAPRDMAVVIVPESPEQTGRYLWFFQSTAPRQRAPDLIQGATDHVTTN